MEDVKPTVAALNPLDQTVRIESSSKRKRHPYQTPRKTKLRKLNASLAQYVSDTCASALSTSTSTDASPKKPSNIPSTLRKTCAIVLFLLCITACTLAPDAIIPRQLIDIYHECQQHFEDEFNAFMYDQPDDADAAAALAQQLAATMQRLGERVAHQDAALELIQQVLSNHSTATPPHTSAMVFVGGSGTGKTLSAGILMRDWLHRPRSNVLHFVWSAAVERLQQFLPEVVAQLSRYERNLLVIDSIPARHHRSIVGFQRELLAHLAGTRSPALLAVYVLNVPTFGGAAVVSSDAMQPQRSTDIVAEMLAGDDDQHIVPVPFESLTSAEQLRECIERERQRLRRTAAVTEEQVQLIGEGIDVRQSGCKHVGARMAMYL